MAIADLSIPHPNARDGVEENRARFLMAQYVFTIGTSDPHPFSATGDTEAVIQAGDQIKQRYPDQVRRDPQQVVTLIGPDGLVTRPSERADEFLRRLDPAGAPRGSDHLQPGDLSAPDCNLD